MNTNDMTAKGDGHENQEQCEGRHSDQRKVETFWATEQHERNSWRKEDAMKTRTNVKAGTIFMNIDGIKGD